MNAQTHDTDFVESSEMPRAVVGGFYRPGIRFAPTCRKHAAISEKRYKFTSILLVLFDSEKEMKALSDTNTISLRID